MFIKSHMRCLGSIVIGHYAFLRKKCHGRLLSIAMQLLLFSFVSPAYADPLDPPPAEAQRNCVPSDIVGKHYKLIFLDETPKRGEAAAYHDFPNHYLAFYPNGTYSFLLVNHNLTDPVDLDKKLLWPLKHKRSLVFTLNNQGELLLYYNKNVRNTYNCTEVIQTVGYFKAGDVILTGYSKKGLSKIYKLYRIWY